MKAEKLPSGKYRIRYYIDGQRKSHTFDHQPTKKEILQFVYSQKEENSEPKQSDTEAFYIYSEKYLDIKSNVLSPSTLRSYSAMNKNIPEWFSCIHISDITQADQQRLINELSGRMTPKAVRNYNGYISAVIRFFCPDKVFNLTLPAKKKPDDYIPTAAEVKKVLELAKDSRYYICFCLGCFGLRRSEILGLTLDDVGSDYVDINKVMVMDQYNKWIIKDIGKTDTSLRRVPIPKELSKAIHNQGYIVDYYPDKILKNLHSFQRKAGVPQFRFHLLRHFFCTELSQKGFSEEDIMALGGWSTPHVMKKVYRHQRIMQDEKAQKKVANTISGLIM